MRAPSVTVPLAVTRRRSPPVVEHPPRTPVALLPVQADSFNAPAALLRAVPLERKGRRGEVVSGSIERLDVRAPGVRLAAVEAIDDDFVARCSLDALPLELGATRKIVELAAIER